jgi:hypothetical protein
MALSSSYHPALRHAMFLQLFLALIVGMILDGGVLARLLLIASIAFWIGVVFILFRRRKHRAGLISVTSGLGRL